MSSLNQFNSIHKFLKDRKGLRVFLVLLFSICILAVSLTFFTLSFITPHMGIILIMDNQGWTVQAVDISGQANQAAIRPGDRPIEINGQPAEDFLEKYTNAGVVFEMPITELAVVDVGGQIKVASLEDSMPSWQSLTEQTAIFFVCLIFWITGFYVYFKRSENTAALLLCLCGLIFGLALSSPIAAARAVPTAIFFQVIASIIGPWLLLHFFLVLPEERFRLRKSPRLYLIYVPAIITIILFPFIGYTDGQPVQWFRSLRLLEYGAGFLASIVVVAFNYFRSTSIKTRQQMKIVGISCLAALVPFLLLSILPEATLGETILPPGFGILFVALIPIGMGYAVVTRKLMDIDVIIRRSLIYGVVTIIMAAIISTALFLAIAFHDSLGVTGAVIIALAIGGIAVILLGPAKKGVESLIDRLFYKDRYDYRQIIQSLNTSLSSLKDLVDISRLIVGTTVNTLNIAGGCLFVKTSSESFEIITTQGIFTNRDKQKELLTLMSLRKSIIEFPNPASILGPDVAFLIPLAAGEKEVGTLWLSHKRTRQGFSSDDMYLLQGLASAGAAALRSAMLIRDVSIRDTFVSVASHELRTPLTLILSYSELLMRRDPPEATRKKWLKNIIDSSERMSTMVDDLLHVSRIQSGKVSINMEQLELSSVLSELLDMMRQSTDQHEFKINLEPDLPGVYIDRDKFGQVIVNLMNNAIKYSPNGGRIIISAHHDPQKHRVVVSIADEGIGISQEDRNLLFTTFHRIRRPETQGIRGSGLGLYIVKEWTEAMGGEVWLESELNKGSTFFVTIKTQYQS